jgi:hypothetical protein
MSHQALEYVRSLERHQVTWKQKSILKVIAEHHKSHLRGAHLSLAKLTNETLTDRSNLQKHLARLEDLNLIEYTPGRGSGNYSQFRAIGLTKGRSGAGCRAVLYSTDYWSILNSIPFGSRGSIMKPGTFLK